MSGPCPKSPSAVPQTLPGIACGSWDLGPQRLAWVGAVSGPTCPSAALSGFMAALSGEEVGPLRDSGPEGAGCRSCGIQGISPKRLGVQDLVSRGGWQEPA